MAKSGNESWAGYSARVIGVPKKRRGRKDRIVTPEDFVAFRKTPLIQRDAAMIQGIVNEMAHLAAIASLHEDEQWAAAADGFFVQKPLNVDDDFENEPLPEVQQYGMESSAPLVDDGTLGWGDLAMDDYQDEDDLIAELNARKDKGWE